MTLVDQGRYGTVCRTALPGGPRVITEAVPGARSVSIGIYAGVGSRDETQELSGASHFLEHVLFKGTKRRSAWEISAEIEAVGGDSNAYTTKEHTCFHVQVLDRDLPLAVDVLCDMITSSVLNSGEFETERGVIFEEIAMREDEPSDLVQELFDNAALGTHPLARPILGTNESIAAITRDQVYDFYRAHYAPSELIVAAAGNLQHEQVVELVATGFGVGSVNGPTAAEHGAMTGPGPLAHFRDSARRHEDGVDVPVITVGATTRRVKDVEQAHLVIGVPGLHRHDERRYALAVLHQVLGGGMSSRLFQEIRERRGLAYSVNTFVDVYADVGLFGVYAGCAPTKLAQVTELVDGELAKVAKHGPTPDEVARGIGMITGGTILDLEDTGSRMGRIGHRELFYDDYASVDDYLARIAAVSVDEVHEIAAQLLVEPYITGLVSPLDV